jgi:uncharacterized membrane protein
MPAVPDGIGEGGVALASKRLTAAALLLSVALAGLGAGAFEVSMATIQVFEDGSVGVNLTIRVADPPEPVVVESLGEPVYYELVSQGVLQPVVYEDGYFNGTVFGEEAFLYYVTTDLTVKNGSLWTLSIDLPWPARIALPGDALILGSDPSPEIDIEGDTVYLVYGPGRVTVSYVILPAEALATEAPPPPTGTKVEEAGDAAPAAGGGAGLNTALLLLAGSALAVLAAVLALRRRRGSVEASTTLEELDDRDRAIIEAVRRLGEASSSDLIEATGIPKTPLYRRLGKLVDMGYLESFERAGKRYYRVKKG